MAAEDSGEADAQALPPSATSPGAATSQRQASETAIQLALTAAAGIVVAEIARRTLSNTITAALAASLWTNAIPKALRDAGVDPSSEIGQSLVSDLREYDLGTQAYQAAAQVVAAASTTYPKLPRSVVASAVEATLSLPSGSLATSASSTGTSEGPAAAGPLPGTSRDTAVLNTDTGNLEWTDSNGAVHVLVNVPDERRLNWEAIMAARARTAATAALGLETLSALAATGVLYKQWVTRHDDRVRTTHARADGQSVGVGQTFSVGADQLKYPGDPAGSPSEIINCRCVIIAGRAPAASEL